MRIAWRRRALADLRALRDYIAQDSPPAASRTAQRVRSAVARLAAFPRQGRPGRDQDTRELVVTGTPYLVVHHLSPDAARILRVLHGPQRRP